MSFRAGWWCLLLASAAVCGCAARAVGSRIASPDSGTLYLYLDALPEGAERLHFEIGSLAAVDDGGMAWPLELRLRALGGAATRHQRLLAMGSLPPGRYRGLEVSVTSARLTGDRGPGALQVLGEPTTTDAPFSIESGAATVRSARLQVEPSMVGGVRFQPVFTIGPPGALAPGLYALATSGSDAGLVVFHKLSGEVFGVLRTGPAPAGIALDAERQLAFVASAEGDTLEVYDLARRIREQRFPVLAGDRPYGIALSADGRTLACAHAGSSVLGVYDAPVLAERFRIPVGLEPRAVLLQPGGQRAFVFNTGSDGITVVDLSAGSVETSVRTDAAPVFGAFDRAGRRLYVIHRNSPYLVVLALPRLTVERRVYVGSQASAIAVDPRTDRLFLARRGTGRIEVFDPASFLPIDAVESRDDVAFLAISPDGDYLYAAVPQAREIRAIRLASNRVAAVTDLGRDPVWIAVAGGR